MTWNNVVSFNVLLLAIILPVTGLPSGVALFLFLFYCIARCLAVIKSVSFEPVVFVLLFLMLAIFFVNLPHYINIGKEVQKFLQQIIGLARLNIFSIDFPKRT